jgi:hypothetical protein
VKKVLLAALFAWSSFAAHAQAYYLDLTAQTLHLPSRQLAVEQVLDGRDGRSAIGVVYRGVGNRSAAVLFRNGLEADLTSFLRAQLPARPADHPVVLCLRQLRVSETIGRMSERANADLAADVYVRLPDGYHFVQSVGAHTSDRTLEATHLHATHLAQLLDRCLSQLDQADWAAAATRPARPLAQLVADVPPAVAAGGRRGAPLILRQPPRRGIYYRFEQFLANQPDTSRLFRLDTVRLRFKSPLAQAKWRGVARVRPLAAGELGGRSTVPKGIWGFSDGQQVYVLHAKHFFPLTRQSNFFTFVGEAPLDQEYAMAVAQAQMRAGAIGVASLRMPDHSAEPMAYALDMRTGELASYPGLRALVRLDTAYVYIYRPAQAAGAEEVQVLVDGHKMGTLRAGQYLEVPWARFGKPLQLCLSDMGIANPCQYVVPNIAQLNYLKINPSKDASAWQWMPPAKGSADLDELDRRTQ